MNQEDFERDMLRIIALGVALAIIEFIAIGFGGGYSLTSIHTGFLAGISLMIVVVVMVWITMSFIGPESS